ncbi:MAG: hypothetical protein Q9162_005760 [Coniocarpon cinnabarinum]
MKSVAVIGAGPGGLVAAKSLLHHDGSPFQVTVFEKTGRLGGLWNLQKGDIARHGFLNPETPTNLSKFTVSFSDLSWDSVSLGLSQTGKARKHDYSRVPMFPKAWMACQYLEMYADQYSLRKKIEFDTEVVAAERFLDEGSTKWKLTVKRSGPGTSKENQHIFDYLVVATGFFAQPRPLPSSLSPQNLPKNIKVVHSSQYRTLNDLIPVGTITPTRNKVLIIGGGNSSGEVAGTLAQHISSALHTPGSTRNDLSHVEILHVTPRPLYALPPFVPAGPSKPGFVPLDLRLYDFGARPGEISSYGGKAPEEVMGMVHGFVRSMIGGDQSDLGASALMSSEDSGKTTGAAYVTLSENYSEFVRSGFIKPIAGYASSWEASKGGTESGMSIRVEHKNTGSTTIEGIAAVINANGYTPGAALEWLPNDVLKDLEYDAKSPRLPLILDMLQTYNTSIPDIGFIGFYEGPYWGVMEMQARLLTETWSSIADQKSFKTKDRYFENKEGLRDLRASMEARDRLIPQYWFSDYLGYMEEAAVDLSLQRNDHPFEEHQGPTSPARYLSSDTSAAEAGRIMIDLQRTMSASENGAFVARATFRALQGKWRLHREIQSATSTLPSGTFDGIASLEPRAPTSGGIIGNSSDGEYLYSEEGTFTPRSGVSMQASRHYVYRFCEAEDSLSVWFVKPDDAKTVDYLYHDVLFTDIKPVEGEGSKQTATAQAEHLCEADLYKTEYVFNFRGISIESWKCKHVVKGPAKDYTAETMYRR